MAKRQARVLDINRYWRTGGTNWETVKEKHDAVIIAAGVGMKKDALLEEHTEMAIKHDIPYGTFHIPDKSLSSVAQAEFYLKLPNVNGHVMIADWESPDNGYTPPMPEDPFRKYLYILDKDSEILPWIYSRGGILGSFGNPTFGDDRKYWIAQYYYANSRKELFKDYETFLALYAWKMPQSIVKTVYEENTALWQITHHGSARIYGANLKTNDPQYPVGMVNADLSVSLIDAVAFLKLFGKEIETPDPEEPPLDCEEAYQNGYEKGAIAGRLEVLDWLSKVLKEAIRK